MSYYSTSHVSHYDTSCTFCDYSVVQYTEGIEKITSYCLDEVDPRIHKLLRCGIPPVWTRFSELLAILAKSPPNETPAKFPTRRIPAMFFVL